MNYVTALIDRSAHCVLSVQCYDFELPVLEAVHGIAPRVVKSKKAEPLSAEEAFERLERRYTNKAAIRSVYRSTSDLARITGLKLSGVAPVEAGSLVITGDEEAKPTRTRRVQAEPQQEAA